MSGTSKLWERSDNPPAFQMQERDIAIVREVFRNRFLTVPHIHALLGGSKDRLGLRCRLLWQHRYLERPKSQRPTKALTEEIVYALGKLGANLLQHRDPNLRIAELDWTETPKKQITFPYIDHQLGVATFMVCLRLAAKKAGLKVRWDGHFNRKKHKLTTPDGKNKFIPDAYFTLELPGKDTTHHFLELDRGSVSPQRMQERYNCYFQVWKARATSGKAPKRFQVLTVTQDPDYVDTLRKAAAPIGRDNSHPATWKALMFSHAEAFSLENSEKILDPIWKYADDGELVSLI